MIVRTRDDIRNTRGDVRTEYWSSYRFLHKEDGMGRHCVCRAKIESASERHE